MRKIKLRRYWRLTLLTVVSLGVALPVQAADRKAAELVRASIAEQSALLAQYPAVTCISDVLRTDCAAKNKGKSADSDFCKCAFAITMSLWRSGADPNMVPRLVAFIKTPSDDGAKTFLQYQGPELYRPVCKAGAD